MNNVIENGYIALEKAIARIHEKSGDLSASELEYQKKLYDLCDKIHHEYWKEMDNILPKGVL